jgi:hypothetical protein
VEPLEREDPGRRGSCERRPGAGHPARRAGRAQRGAGRPGRDRRAGLGAGQQLGDIVVGDEALGVRAGQDHGADAVVGLRPGDQVGERRDRGVVEQAVRRVVERRHEHAPALLDGDRPGHAGRPSSAARR